jgi:hypothetical protein
MTGRKPPKGPNYVNLPEDHRGRISAPRTTECCAKCRRGIKGFGELPCGYLGACPNDCHKTKGAR